MINKDEFIKIGQQAGVSPPDLIELVADYVWRVCDPSKSDCVKTALEDMGIRKDLAQRWHHAWCGYLGWQYKEMGHGQSP